VTPRFLVSVLWSLVVLAAPALAATHPSPTPTPRPKLSGGFGRPRATVTPSDPAAGGQTLADVVRAAHDGKPAEKAASGEHSGVVIDNRSLVTDPHQGRLTTSRAVHQAPAKAAAKIPDAPAGHDAPGAAQAAAPAASGEAGGTPTEAEWRGIANGARQRVSDAKAKVAELEAATKKLENDFYAWDDGQYRDRVIKPSWDASRQKLDEAKAELAAAEKDLTDLPERARKAGALPGWIRE
jgi:hypothetical protein